MEENKNVCSEECEKVEQTECDCETDAAEAAADSEEKCSAKDKKKQKKAEAEIEKLTAALAEEQDKYMRLYAEYDNFRKRNTKEKELLYTLGKAEAVEKLLK